jgi:hypothetical protein
MNFQQLAKIHLRKAPGRATALIVSHIPFVP